MLHYVVEQLLKELHAKRPRTREMALWSKTASAKS
jgi:hypothetical protein